MVGKIIKSEGSLGVHGNEPVSAARLPIGGKRVLDAEEVDARGEARGIVAQAQQEAAQIRARALADRDDVFEKAKEEGRQVGLAEMTVVIAKAKLEWGEVVKKAEPDIVQLAIKVAERIIGAELQSTESTIVHIVARAIDQLRQNKELVLRLNPADAEYLRREKRQLLETVGRLKDIGFKDDPRVKRGGCIIETENGSVDAQLATQLELLEEALLETGGPS
jgi:type III secretion protein L